MGLILNAWGPAGTLTSRAQLGQFQGNGVVSASPSESAVGDRANVQDGIITFRRYAGDAIAANGKRTEMAYANDAAQMIDWVDAEEEGADADESYRWYRVRFLVPNGFPLSHMSAAGAFTIVFQAHQRNDTSPPDTDAPPAFAVCIRLDAYGRPRFCVVQNNDSAETSTAVTLRELYSWRYRTEAWQDVLLRANPWSWSSAGNMEVWVNRRPLQPRVSEANTSNDAPSRGGGGLYPKIGIYTSGDLDMEVQHRGLIIGDKDATFAEMHPEDPDAVPLERVSGPLSSVF